MTAKRIKISEVVGEPHLPHFNDKHTLHQIDKGGRASTKSSKNEVKIPFLFLNDPTAEAVVVRKFYKDHRDTSFAGLRIGFERLGWELLPDRDYPKGKHSTMYISTTQGNYVHFVGLNDYQSQKGARPTKLGNQIKILWLFEITQFEDEAELNNVISNYVRGNKDWFIILYEFNPPAKKSHWVYGWLDKMQSRVGKDTYIQHTNYNDLPEWQQHEWLGDILLGEIEQLKQIDYEQFKWIYLGLPANLAGSVYKKFLEQQHVDEVERDPNDYLKFSVGIDYGETDATSFTLYGILKGFKGARTISQFWHKNGESQGDFGIIEYADEFFDFMQEFYDEFHRPCKVYVDSAAKHFWSYLRKEQARRGVGHFQIETTDKRKKNDKYDSALEERIAIANIMFGADFMQIDPSCKHLIKALSECERDKNGDRKDDGTTDMDSIDSWEYAWMKDMQLIIDVILKQRGYNTQRQRRGHRI